jgi:thioredoxin-dependent peroxiredoxin
MKAPAFTLNDQHGNPHSLSDYKGKWVVLYFYPKDMTPGCTQEACDFRDNLNRLTSSGTAVLGVSADSEARHKKFAEKESLSFPLLADTDHAMCEAYGVWQTKKFMGREYDGIVRTTLIINPVGEIVKRYESVSVKGHVDAVIKDLEELKNG